MKKYITRIQQYIENEPWDDWLDEKSRVIDAFCLGMVVMSLFIIVPALIQIVITTIGWD